MYLIFLLLPPLHPPVCVQYVLSCALGNRQYLAILAWIAHIRAGHCCYFPSHLALTDIFSRKGRASLVSERAGARTLSKGLHLISRGSARPTIHAYKYAR